MATAVKTKSSGAGKKQETPLNFDPETMFINSKGEVKRLSKAGIWSRKNPKGIFEYVDWRAVNK
jgi:hypothetical protein